jgi:hypothetical protein
VPLVEGGWQWLEKTQGGEGGRRRHCDPPLALYDVGSQQFFVDAGAKVSPTLLPPSTLPLALFLARRGSLHPQQLAQVGTLWRA